MSSTEIQHVNIERLSYVSAPLKILSPTGEFISSCTGFFYEIDGNYFLVTNRHCFTGKHNNTNEPLSSKGFILPSQV
jgi:hypothetical protein